MELVELMGMFSLGFAGLSGFLDAARYLTR